MAKNAKKAPSIWRAVPLDEYGQSDFGAKWLGALDMLLPNVPRDYLTLFQVIGPEGTDKRAEAAQNANVARIMGVNVRTIQRYRRTELGLAANSSTRGQSASAQFRVLSAVGPVARTLIIRRFMALTELYGLWMDLAGEYQISETIREDWERDGGVTGEFMQTTADAVDRGQFDNAAWEYLREWCEDWGINGSSYDRQTGKFDTQMAPSTDTAESFANRILDDAQAARGGVATASGGGGGDGFILTGADSVELALGYPDQDDVPADSQDWMYRDDLASYASLG